MPKVKIQTVHNYKISLLPTNPLELLCRGKNCYQFLVHPSRNFIELTFQYSKRIRRQLSEMYCSQIQLNKAEMYQYYVCFSPFSDYNGFKFAVLRLSYDELLHFIFLSKIPTGKYLLMSFVLSSCKVFTTYLKTLNILKQLTNSLNFIESCFVF